jgi:hypothetical protein
MVELHSWIIIAWTIGTALMAFGSAWGAIRVTQKSVENTLKELKLNVTSLAARLSQDEKDYMPRRDCREIRGDCREQQNRDNIHICAKIDEVKSFLISMEEKRIKSKDEYYATFTQIRERLTKIEAKLNGAS